MTLLTSNFSIYLYPHVCTYRQFGLDFARPPELQIPEGGERTRRSRILSPPSTLKNFGPRAMVGEPVELSREEAISELYFASCSQADIHISIFQYFNFPIN